MSCGQLDRERVAQVCSVPVPDVDAAGGVVMIYSSKLEAVYAQ